tara:strand:+ start:143 stop:457 length:315 start_codon:yes stop_codon:yes gene_type:complete
MINTFVNAILAPTGMAVVLSLGILKLVDSEPHGFSLGLVGFVISLIVIGALTVLYTKKPAAGWAVLIGYTVVLTYIGGPHLFTFGMLGFCWAFAKIGCLATDEH